MTIPQQHTIETPYMVGPVHCYTLEYENEIVLVDTGPPTESGRKFLSEHIDLARLKHVIITHCHVDHYGQAAWLEQNSDATIYLPQRDILKHKHHETRLEMLFGLLADMGFGDGYLEKLEDSFYRAVLFLPFPERYLTSELDIPDRLGINVTQCAGHSQSDLVYYGNGWAVTGDILLRGVFQSPLLDVDLEQSGRFKNYEAYCSSIVKLWSLRDKLILPGHRYTIESVEATILFYISKMLHRVKQLLPHIGSNSIARIIEDVFSTMNDPFHIYLKASEIVFMSDFLQRPELLSLALEEIGLYESVADSFSKVIKN